MNELPIAQFQGEYRFLSNFAPCPVTYEGVEYPSVEHAYQAAKCVHPEDRAVILAGHAGQAKRHGTVVEKIAGWNKRRKDIMRALLEQKFRTAMYRELLLNTNQRTITEGNYWNDEYWGVNLKTNRGLNLLGKMIMEIRSDLETDCSIDISATYPQQHNLSDDSKAVLLQHYFS